LKNLNPYCLKTRDCILLPCCAIACFNCRNNSRFLLLDCHYFNFVQHHRACLPSFRGNH
jgi:hypothetical protein